MCSAALLFFAWMQDSVLSGKASPWYSVLGSVLAISLCIGLSLFLAKNGQKNAIFCLNVQFVLIAVILAWERGIVSLSDRKKTDDEKDATKKHLSLTTRSLFILVAVPFLLLLGFGFAGSFSYDDDPLAGFGLLLFRILLCLGFILLVAASFYWWFLKKIILRIGKNSARRNSCFVSGFLLLWLGSNVWCCFMVQPFTYSPFSYFCIWQCAVVPLMLLAFNASLSVRFREKNAAAESETVADGKNELPISASKPLRVLRWVLPLGFVLMDVVLIALWFPLMKNSIGEVASGGSRYDLLAIIFLVCSLGLPLLCSQWTILKECAFQPKKEDAGKGNWLVMGGIAVSVLLIAFVGSYLLHPFAGGLSAVDHAGDWLSDFSTRLISFSPDLLFSLPILCWPLYGVSNAFLKWGKKRAKEALLCEGDGQEETK